MAQVTKIDLVEPFQWFDRTVTAVSLVKPSGFLYMKHGEPRFGVVAADGSQYWIEKDDIVSTYLAETLMIDGERVDGGDAVFRVMSLDDIIQIKDALFGFFTHARAMATLKASSSAAPPSSDNSGNSSST